MANEETKQVSKLPLFVYSLLCTVDDPKIVQYGTTGSFVTGTVNQRCFTAIPKKLEHAVIDCGPDMNSQDPTARRKEEFFRDSSRSEMFHNVPIRMLDGCSGIEQDSRVEFRELILTEIDGFKCYLAKSYAVFGPNNYRTFASNPTE
jgi:hypothetical protein